jgi:hypothetical protein
VKQNENQFTDEELRQAYDQNPALGHLAAHFRVPNITIFRRAQRLGLEFKNGGVRTKFTLDDILAGKHPQYNTLKLKIRLLEEGIKKNECEVCGISEWLGKPLVIQLDHINGIPSDHRLENLQMVCPNCHSQTETFCGRNK